LSPEVRRESSHTTQRRRRMLLVALDTAYSIGDMNAPGLSTTPVKRIGTRPLVCVGKWKLANDFSVRDGHAYVLGLPGLSPMAMHNPPHAGEFITEVYLEPNNLSARELASKLCICFYFASHSDRNQRGQSRDGAALCQGAGTIPWELACDARQLRSVASKTTSKAWRRWQG
jgi:hypothetical protein